MQNFERKILSALTLTLALVAAPTLVWAQDRAAPTIGIASTSDGTWDIFEADEEKRKEEASAEETSADGDLDEDFIQRF